MYSLNQLAKDLIKNLNKSSVVMGHDKSFSSLEKSIKDSPLEDQEKEYLLKKIIELDIAQSIGIDL